MKSFIIVLISFLYSIIRYNYFGDVSLTELPLFIFNKAISMSSVLLLLFANLGFNNLDKKPANSIKNLSLFLITLHAVLSLLLVSKVYFPDFYQAERFSFNGGVTLTAGVISIILFFTVFLNTAIVRKENFGIFEILTYVFVSIHIFFRGYKGWITVEKWHGGMPPISLITFIAIVIAGALFSQNWSKKNKLKNILT